MLGFTNTNLFAFLYLCLFVMILSQDSWPYDFNAAISRSLKRSADHSEYVGSPINSCNEFKCNLERISRMNTNSMNTQPVLISKNTKKYKKIQKIQVQMRGSRMNTNSMNTKTVQWQSWSSNAHKKGNYKLQRRKLKKETSLWVFNSFLFNFVASLLMC